MRPNKDISDPVTPAPGELWFIRSEEDPAERALVCVIESDAARGRGRPDHPVHASVAFTDTDLESATDGDLCYALGEAAPWTLRVSTNLVGPVRLSSFAYRVGRVPTDPNLLREAVLFDRFAPELAARRGLPLHGPHDTRLASLEARLDEMWQFFLAPLTDFD